ncbi:MAG: diguanylate cyclase [Actinomycetota bacterium]|nr:diguanylate cyclase [Actinomycetota bacterium]
MKFRHRITALATVGVVAIALAAFGVLSPVLASNADQEAAFERALLVERVHVEAQDAARLGEVFVTGGSGDDLIAFEEAAMRFERSIARYRTLVGDSALAAGPTAEYVAHAEESWADVRSAVSGRAAGVIVPAEATVRITGAIGSLMASLEDLAADESERAREATSRVGASVVGARTTVVVLGLAAVAVIVAVTVFASRSVARPLTKLDDAVQRLAAGDLEHPVPQLGKDEIGEVASAVEQLRVSLREALAALHSEIEERTTTEEALAEANHELNRLLDGARHASDEMHVMGEMGELLQADLSWDEAYAVMASYGRRLFERLDGALYLYGASDGELERKVDWGDSGIQAERYRPEECWSLRTGKPHWVRFGEPDLPPCAHIDAPDSCSACVPLVAHGEVLGTIVLLGPAGESLTGEQGTFEHMAGIVAAFAGRVALAISNMQLRETLREQSLRDPLTGLYNRRIMEEALTREIARAGREVTPLVVGLIDIDHFKEFNDTFGHEAGDHVLREVGAYLRDNTRAGDVVCRFGGEEFVVIWAGTDIAAGFSRAEALRQGVGELAFALDGESIGQVTLSIGVALLGEHGDSGDALLSAADAALYAAKAEGRDRVVLALTSERPHEREALLPRADLSTRSPRIG